MGEMWTSDKLILFLAFFVPGFIAMQVYTMIVPTEQRDFVKSLPEAIAYSAIHYAIFGWILLVTHDVWFYVALYVIWFVLPVLEAPVVLLARDWVYYAPKLLTGAFMQNLLKAEMDHWIAFSQIQPSSAIKP